MSSKDLKDHANSAYTSNACKESELSKVNAWKTIYCEFDGLKLPLGLATSFLVISASIIMISIERNICKKLYVKGHTSKNSWNLIWFWGIC